ncbi:MAG: type III-B CRISPR module RAMP protein Cmr1 [Meiothermus sp.]|uniref:type III-B CRISPR module RAMP protein Cmr1 n=1 Tax=Meiothermus sp. TaxID=1955249 RepID=UPI0021DD1AFB|nr:type III-B CRISPR module RAMP protein Cmr1 [Meiothermus sp.]GIW29299.1 MAG: type III-B CRISPR module RAMP protein Cmr1 [Meiothermus sp.]
MRKVPVFQEEYHPKLKSGWIELERTYRLLTPLFGGGVNPKYADPVSAVRATEIKGQLRFWWRAARAGGLSLQAMREQEAELFGASSGDKGLASPLVLEIEPLDLGQEREPFYLEPGKSFPKNRPEIAPGYVAFPLQSNRQDPKNYPVRVGVRFRLRLRYPERVRQEIEAALWAWEHFGGVGGRTRRGFGAIWPEDATPPTQQAIQAEWNKFVRKGEAPEGVPSLSGARWRLVERSWREVADLYQKFRQARNAGQQPNRPGRSRWPEPDAIRNLLGRAAPKHRQPILQPPILKFPRAQFGLPIVVHFKDSDDPSTQIVPASSEIERLASPLIFRPLADKRSIVLILNTPRTPPGGVALQTGKAVDIQLTQSEAQRITPLKGEADPLLAFLNQL